MKTRQEIESRIDELREERSDLFDKLEAARVEAKRAIIEGGKQTTCAAELAERLGLIDEVLAELDRRLGAAAASADRRQRIVRAENALAAAAAQRKLAEAVDGALSALATAWPAYQEALRTDVGPLSAANGDVGPVDRGLVTNRRNDVLVRVLVGAGGTGLVRALGVETAIRERHATGLATAEERVAKSLRREHLRVRAEGPEPNIARQAERELEMMGDAA